jgi:DNA polymerase-1
MTDDGLPILSISTEPDLFSSSSVIRHLSSGQLPLARAITLIKPLLEDASVLKIGHNIKYDILVMGNYGIDITPIEDTMLISYALHAGEHGQGMDELAERYLGHKNISFDDVTGTGKKRLRFDEVEIDKATAYAAEDADITLRLWELMKPQLAKEKLLTLYETIERPLIPAVERMERAGIKVDVAKLRALSSDFATRMQEYEREIMTLAGTSFNVASPKQLGEILFERLGLEGGKKSAKTGAYGTGNDVLEELAEAGHTIAQRVIDWRQLAKLKNTYCDTLPEQINPQTGRVHTNFALAIAATGRLSSSDPNVQNIPIRSEEGRKIREAFIAEQGNLLLSADYSQIELRLLAHMADIPTLKEAFRNGDDIHAITASNMFGVPMAEMTSDLRRSAKAINFGIIYGISAHGLSQQLSIGRSEAAGIIERYFAQYPGIKDYMESCKEFARTHGYVQTLFGRRCHTPMINDKNGARRQFAERAAINAPLQGTAADIIKRAMIAIDAIRPAPFRMLLQVHDELIFEAPEAKVESVKPILKKTMENAAQLSIPLTVEIGSGNHWNDAH